MIIHVYAMCYNEEIMMPYFLRHYNQFADKIFIFDNHSTDKTAEIVDSNKKAKRILYGRPDRLYDSDLIKMKNEEYKKSRGQADWVIIADVDEFVYHQNLAELLKRYKSDNIHLPKTAGYDMLGDDYPKTPGQLYEEINQGVSESFYSKRAIFNPELNVRYVEGAHKCFVSGKYYESPTAEIKLLHYRFLCKEFFVKTMERRQLRCSEENIKKGWGYLKLPPGETVRSWSERQYDTKKKLRVKIV